MKTKSLIQKTDRYGRGRLSLPLVAALAFALSCLLSCASAPKSAESALPAGEAAPITPKPLVIPGKTTVTEAVALGWKEISPAEWQAIRQQKVEEGNAYLIGGPYNLIAKDGIIQEIQLWIGRGDVPPKELIGFELDPKASYRDTIALLLESGYEVKIVHQPHADFKGADYKTHILLVEAMIVARHPAVPDVAFDFFFMNWRFWGNYEPDRLVFLSGRTPETLFNQNKPKASAPKAITNPGDNQQRALDLSVFLSLQNSSNYLALMPDTVGDRTKIPQIWQDFLSRTWSINSREDYFKTFDDMVAEGHTKSYSDAMALLEANPDVPILSLALANGYDSYRCDRLFYVAQTKNWLGARSLRAWDLARMINVSRWAYGAGYITDSEAWERILPVAKTLRELYGSREDFVASYLGGRGFWGADDPMKYIEEAYAVYLKDFANIDSRQSLPWYRYYETSEPDAAAAAAKGRPALIGDILYTVTDEQLSARATYARFNAAIDTINAGITENDYGKAYSAMDTAETILKGNRVGEFNPDLYYRIRFVRAQILAATGSPSLALEVLGEVNDRFPGSEDVLRLMGECKNRLGETE